MFIPQEVVTVHRPDRPAQTFQHQGSGAPLWPGDIQDFHWTSMRSVDESYEKPGPWPENFAKCGPCFAVAEDREEGQEGRKAWQLLWRADAAAAARAGRLFFERQPRVRQAASSVFAFRRLLRESHHNLPPLQPEVHYDGSCVPRWPTNSSGLAFLLHISKSGGTALREVLQRGPGIAGCRAVRFRPSFPEEWQDKPVNVTNFSVGRLHWTYEKRHALEHGSVGMVPGGHLAWELQMPRLMELATANHNKTIEWCIGHRCLDGQDVVCLVLLTLYGTLLRYLACARFILIFP
eukprot:g32252.t2